MAVVIVSYDTRELTLRAVASAFDARDVDVDVWVVDNASGDGSADAVRARFPRARVIALEENVGFGRGNNAALERTDAPFVLLLNSDATFADAGGLRRMVRILEEEARVGVVGPRLESPGGDLEYSARAFPGILGELARRLGLFRLLPHATRARLLGTEFFDHGRRGEPDWLTGACLLVRGSVLAEVGGFDPGIFLYGEELEWCWRVRRAGWSVAFDPSVTVVHHRGASGGTAQAWRVRLAMAGDAYSVRKHRGGAYFAAFFAARCVALAGEALAQGLLGVLTGSAERRARSGWASMGLAQWMSAVFRGGSAKPGALARGRPA